MADDPTSVEGLHRTAALAVTIHARVLLRNLPDLWEKLSRQPHAAPKNLEAIEKASIHGVAILSPNELIAVRV